MYRLFEKESLLYGFHWGKKSPVLVLPLAPPPQHWCLEILATASCQEAQEVLLECSQRTMGVHK